MLFKRKRLVFTAAVLFVLPVSAGPIAYVEGLNFSSGAQQFGTLDLSSGAYQSIGPGLMEGSAGLVPAAGGLLTLGSSGNLDLINPSTGIETVIGATGLGDCSNPGVSACGPNSANAFADLNGALYATDFAGNLYSLDPITGHATLIGLTGIPAITFVPFSMNADGSLNVFDENLTSAGGTLYASVDILTIDPNNGTIVSVVQPNNLYQINTATGQATLIAPTTTPINSFVNVNGVEYAFNGGSPPTQVLTINLANGDTSVITNADPNAGLIFGAAPAPVPEPASLLLVGFGIVVMVWVTKKFRWS